MTTRRLLLAAAACAATAPAASLAARSPEPPAGLPLNHLKLYIPGAAGGGWDQTGRGLGAAIKSGALAREIDYENKGGKGGTVGLADFVSRHGRDPHALFVGGLVMLGALAVNKDASASLKDLHPIARLSSDYMVLAVTPGSKIKTIDDLIADLKRDPAAVTFTGGSIGGVDHILAVMILRSLRLNTGALKYVPTSSGREALETLAKGDATVAISGYSEFKTAMKANTIVPLAVSSRRSMFNLPALRERGIDTEMANWRAVFAPAGLRPEQHDMLRTMVIRATDTPAWRQTLLDNDWVGSLLYGKELDRFIELENVMVNVVSMSILKLRG